MSDCLRDTLTRIIVGLFAWTIAVSCARAGNPGQDYVLFCMGCHGERAQGVAGRVPPLAHSIARFMRTAEGRAYLIRVPGVSASALTDEQIASLLNWLADQFDSEDLTAGVSHFAVEEVTALREPLADAAALRKRVVSNLAATGHAPPEIY